MMDQQKIPRINVNDDSVQIVHWYLENNSLIHAGDDLVELSTSKANITIQAEYTGYIQFHLAPGDIGIVGTPLASFTKEAQNTHLFAGDNPALTSSTTSEKFLPSKQAATFINDCKLDSEIYSSLGLVTEYGLKKMLTKIASIEKVEKISLAKLTEINALMDGQSSKINSSISVILEAKEILSALKNKVGATNGNNILPTIIFELSQLLEKYPSLNSFFNKNQIHFYKNINIGLAIDLGKGIKVATLTSTNKKSLCDIAENILALSLKYMENKLSLEEMSGSTFTVTDLSTQNIMYFQPLINSGQAAVLGIGGDSKQKNHPLTLTLVFDHRILNGREAAFFLNELKDRLLSYSQAI